jgi:hemerythrin-like domain-containing protein
VLARGDALAESPRSSSAANTEAPPAAEHFDAKATMLIKSFSHHIEEEEQDWFPKVRAALGRKQLQEIGAKLEQARRKAPTTPAEPSALKKTIDAVIS